MGLLVAFFFGCPIANLRQWFVAVLVGARPGDFVLALFGKPSAERVVGVCPDFGIAGGLYDFGADKLVFEVVLVILVFAVGQLAIDQVVQCFIGAVI